MPRYKPSFLISILCFFLYFFQSCQENTRPFIPQRPQSIDENQYEKFREKLIEAYDAEDYYLVAFNLANLQSPKEPIYENLKRAVKQDSLACTEIFEVNYLAEQGFYRHIYRIDTTEFKQVFDLCLLQMGRNSYASYRQKEIEETRLYLASRAPLDSSLFDWDLIEILKEIDEDDQKFRKKMRSLNISEAEKKRLFARQVQIDSVNLSRVDSILTNWGYPSREKVGHDYSDVIVMIVHHQSDPAIRQEYLNRIRKYISLEQTEMIEKRTRRIIQDN